MPTRFFIVQTGSIFHIFYDGAYITSELNPNTGLGAGDDARAKLSAMGVI